jgi:hypothetical protein
MADEPVPQEWRGAPADRPEQISATAAGRARAGEAAALSLSGSAADDLAVWGLLLALVLATLLAASLL